MKVVKKVAENPPKPVGKIAKTEKLLPKVKGNKVKKPKTKKKRRLIIRNLSFKVDEEELKEIFSKFGKLIDVKIPLKDDGKKRGFAFVEFEDSKSLIKAMKSMNYKEIQGRKVAVDFAVDKTSYQLKVQNLKQEGKDFPQTKEKIKSEMEIKKESDSDEESDEVKIKEEDESEEEDEDEKKLNDFLKEFDSGAEALTKSFVQDDSEKSSSEESSSDESDDEEEEKNDIAPKRKVKQEFESSESPTKKAKTRISQDVSEGKTVFLRNVAYTSSEESLREAIDEYGECVYCLLCMDQFTDHPKGTAFVKFKEKSSADKLIQESFGEPGVVVDGRKLTCSYAMSREDASHIGEDSKKPKDKRNLNLLRVGLIMADSKESEGVSKSDMTKRAQLEIVKKQKLRNVNFFVSDTRLIIYNCPKNYTDNDLRKLFKKAGGRGAVITEARIMKEFKKTDSQGNPLSKGFGFVCFDKHEDALQALTELNNNPSTFSSQTRPIVEFSIENKVALLSKERKKEKIQMRNKRRTEEKKERQLNQVATDAVKASSESPAKGKKKRRKNKKSESTENKKMKKSTDENKNSLAEESSPETKQKKKRKRKPRQSRKTKNIDAIDKSKQDNMVNLINSYKEKIQNKIP